jgi:hypothetical protein
MKFTEILFSINLFLVLAFSFPTSLRGSAVISNEQNINNNNNNNNNDKEAYRILIPGGWNEIQHPDEEERVVSIAKWACNQIYPEECSNVNVISAEQQVVAGMNYRLVFKHVLLYLIITQLITIFLITIISLCL